MVDCAAGGSGNITDYIKVETSNQVELEYLTDSMHPYPNLIKDIPGELTRFFPQIDRIFPSATSKLYLKG